MGYGWCGCCWCTGLGPTLLLAFGGEGCDVLASACCCWIRGSASSFKLGSTAKLFSPAPMLLESDGRLLRRFTRGIGTRSCIEVDVCWPSRASMTSEEGVDHMFVAVEVGQFVRKFRSKRRVPPKWGILCPPPCLCSMHAYTQYLKHNKYIDPLHTLYTIHCYKTTK